MQTGGTTSHSQKQTPGSWTGVPTEGSRRTCRADQPLGCQDSSSLTGTCTSRPWCLGEARSSLQPSCNLELTAAVAPVSTGISSDQPHSCLSHATWRRAQLSPLQVGTQRRSPQLHCKARWAVLLPIPQGATGHQVCSQGPWPLPHNPLSVSLTGPEPQGLRFHPSHRVSHLEGPTKPTSPRSPPKQRGTDRHSLGLRFFKMYTFS